MNIKTLFLYSFSLSLLAFAGCEKQELIENTVADTYTFSLKGSSLVGNIEMLMDGEVISQGSLLDIPKSQPFLRSKGERKLELREVGKTGIIETWTLNAQGDQQDQYDISFYWNGEELTNELKMPTVAEGNIGFMLRIDMDETKSTEPMDIEILYNYWDENYESQMTEPLDIVGDDNDLIEGYIAGSGYASQFIQVRVPNPMDENYVNEEFLSLRLYKAGTQDQYYNIMTQGGYHYDQPECYIITTLTKAMIDTNGSNTFMMNISELTGSLYLDDSYLDWSGKIGEISFQDEYIWGNQTEEPAE